MNLFSMNSSSLGAQVGALVKGLEKLPMHIAKKHMKAAMKRALKFGLPILRSRTPVGKGLRDGDGKRVKGSRGALRKAVTTKSVFVGKNKGGFVVGGLGYKYGMQSRKAIWLEFGTNKGIEPRRFMEETYNQIKGQVAGELVRELKNAMEKAAKDTAPGVDQHYRRK